MRKVSLYYQQGSSDKEYHVQLVEDGELYKVNFQYGRRGSSLKAGTKTEEAVPLEAAIKIYEKLVNSKKAKGYIGEEGEAAKDVFSGEIAKASKEVIDLPQLLNPIEDPEYYIESDEWLAQEKKDGERRMVRFGVGLNRKGQEVPLPKELVNILSKDIFVDGEIIGNKLYVFDLLFVDGEDLKNLACGARIEILEERKDIFNKNIKLVEAAYTTAQKRKLFNQLKNDNKEGIVFKKKVSTYQPGRPATGGNQVKFKFYKTATFIVANHTKGKRSVGMELLDGEKKVNVGKVTIPPNYAIPEVGSLIEVRYLYAYKGGSVYQPTYLGNRHDLYIEDAVMSQLIYKNE